MNPSATFIEALVSALRRAADYNTQAEVPPCAVLWTDKERQWEALLPQLRDALPTLLCLGPYDPANRTGPAIWLRCMIAQTLPEADGLDDATPILYLPGVDRREALRANENCPPHLQPLAELQFRGKVWTHTNGRDWTIAAFLQNSDGGLGIEVNGDAATREALQRALPKLAEMPVAALSEDAPLNAAKINALLNPEPVLKVLLWLNDPTGQRQARDEAEWQSFREICRHDFGFDPDTDGELTAARLLGDRQGIWQTVWRRFEEAPKRYPALDNLLLRARPPRADSLFYDASSWPQDNLLAEGELCMSLEKLVNSTPSEARAAIAQLESQHGERRDWVWAELGQSPLALALSALQALTEATAVPCGGLTPQEVAIAYTQQGWKADAAALAALSGVEKSDDVAAMKVAVAALYRDWLRQTAEALQRAVREHPLPAPPPPDAAKTPGAGCCLLFVDGLRFDIGQQLAQSLEAKGLSVARDWQFAALPGVTPTAKPAVSPVAGLLGPGSEFNATVLSDGAKVTVEVLRRELTKSGYQVLTGDESGDPTGAGWTEFGNFDSYGHAQGWMLARRVPEERRALEGRVQRLLDAGWKEVRIITDHGWLLLPGGLPKVELPEHLTEPRKGRCARLKPGAITDQQVVPWHWDALLRIAVAPGIGCYVSGKEYEHGGLSPQECIVPVLTVGAKAPEGPTATIKDVVWKGLRCRVDVTGSHDALTVDIRTKATDAATSLVAAVKAVSGDGQASVVMPDDDRIGEAAVVVLLDAGGRVVSQRATIIGE